MVMELDTIYLGSDHVYQIVKHGLYAVENGLELCKTKDIADIPDILKGHNTDRSLA